MLATTTRWSGKRIAANVSFNNTMYRGGSGSYTLLILSSLQTATAATASSTPTRPVIRCLHFQQDTKPHYSCFMSTSAQQKQSSRTNNSSSSANKSKRPTVSTGTNRGTHPHKKPTKLNQTLGRSRSHPMLSPSTSSPLLVDTIFPFPAPLPPRLPSPDNIFTPVPSPSSSSFSSFSSSPPWRKWDPIARPPQARVYDQDPTTTSAPHSLLVRMARTLHNRFSWTRQQKRIQRGAGLFQAALRQATDPNWFGPGRFDPRDFVAQHALITMHVWFLHKRLILDAHKLLNHQSTTTDRDDSSLDFRNEHADTLAVQEDVFNLLWYDTAARVRAFGARELLVNKYVTQIQKKTLMHMIHYDTAFDAPLRADPAARMREVRNIVRRYFLHPSPQPPLDENDDPNEKGNYNSSTERESDPIGVKEAEIDTISNGNRSMDFLDRMAWYIEVQYQNMTMYMPDEYFRQGRVKWVNLPDFTNLRDDNGHLIRPTSVQGKKNARRGKKSKTKEEEENINSNNNDEEEEVLPEWWLRSLTPKGEFYYWNTQTGESTWERPLTKMLN